MRNVIFSFLAIVISFASACEPDCRHGIAEEFANRYTPLIETVMDNLHDSLSVNLYTVSAPEHLLAAVPESVLQEGINSMLDDVLEDFMIQFTGPPLEGDIHQVIFGGDDPFKGDCNNPKRLERKRPMLNESWTLDECKAMDYICGNPPSICHFLDLIKQRIVKYLSTQLQEHAAAANGVLFQILKENTKQTVRFIITNYGAGSLSDDPAVVSYVNDLIAMIHGSLSSWVTTDIIRLCEDPVQDELCNGWDDQIRLEILKWP